ncbi:hypothetical protein PGTUg99_035327 [Puccinia graminis f. sp. tritici]|uniref:Uncharacterized protein n=1 Tax=Puccinia graminis f. sp. tritici TaxID=56615 RepID=A0A5B0SM78_PUCGR|nr:hypothetical protein PGTUg99_035327 [Puccinia graminis f. sp. tritici]
MLEHADTGPSTHTKATIPDSSSSAHQSDDNQDISQSNQRNPSGRVRSSAKLSTGNHRSPPKNHGKHFHEAPVIVITCDTAPTPNPTNPGRTRKPIHNQSLSFLNHELLKPLTAELYDPNQEFLPAKIAHLFHRTRKHSLDQLFKHLSILCICC